MIPYLVMMSMPGSLALSGVRKPVILFALIFLLYWLMTGFRFHVGGDWNPYLEMYFHYRAFAPGELLLQREPGFKLLIWLASETGLGFIGVNVISALVFCLGFFAVARKCGEPFIAIVVATPLLVVAFGMSAARQAIALGIIFLAYASWEKRSTISRMALVFIAALFHFSALFVLVFVALSSRFPLPLRLAGAVAVGLIILLITIFAPESVESYSRLYLSSKIQAPGAIAHVGVLAVAALTYFLYRKEWIKLQSENLLYRDMAFASLIALPAILVSSVGAYRFSLYFWPMAMYVWAGLPALIQNATARAFYRIMIVSMAFVLLVSWLQFANTSMAWLPYRNWLFEPDYVGLRR